jgi:hypothetical protein
MARSSSGRDRVLLHAAWSCWYRILCGDLRDAALVSVHRAYIGGHDGTRWPRLQEDQGWTFDPHAQTPIQRLPSWEAVSWQDGKITIAWSVPQFRKALF